MHRSLHAVLDFSGFGSVDLVKPHDTPTLVTLKRSIALFLTFSLFSSVSADATGFTAGFFALCAILAFLCCRTPIVAVKRCRLFLYGVVLCTVYGLGYNVFIATKASMVMDRVDLAVSSCAAIRMAAPVDSARLEQSTDLVHLLDQVEDARFERAISHVEAFSEAFVGSLKRSAEEPCKEHDLCHFGKWLDASFAGGATCFPEGDQAMNCAVMGKWTKRTAWTIWSLIVVVQFGLLLSSILTVKRAGRFLSDASAPAPSDCSATGACKVVPEFLPAKLKEAGDDACMA